MADLYERKFVPDKRHIIAYILILLSAVLFISGFHRAMRVTGRLSMQGLVFEPEVHEGDSILLSAKPFKARLKDTERVMVVSCEYISELNPFKDCEIFIIHIAGQYRPVMVTVGTEEYDKFMNGEEVTGYFTEKNFDDFPYYMSNIGSYYELEKEITDKSYSKLGIVIVNRQKELISFVWGIPFLIAGIILLKISGTPFVYIKIDDEEE